MTLRTATELAALSNKRRPAAGRPLTGRQREILELMASGLTNGQIAGKLGTTAETVKETTKRIFAKLDVCSRAAAVDRAWRLGVLGRNEHPSRSFCAVLGALEEMQRGYVAELVAASGVDRAGTTRLLSRLHRLALADRETEEGDPRELGRARRIYYAITPLGSDLAGQLILKGGVAR